MKKGNPAIPQAGQDQTEERQKERELTQKEGRPSRRGLKKENVTRRAGEGGRRGLSTGDQLKDKGVH